MGFKITSGDPTEMYEGQIITYVVGILPGVKSNWVTEITHVNEPSFFVDEQRFGPYSMWHHQHSFEESNDGIIARDKVSYKIPFGMLGHLANSLFIQDQLRSIFTYRAETLSQIFKA